MFSRLLRVVKVVCHRRVLPAAVWVRHAQSVLLSFALSKSQADPPFRRPTHVLMLLVLHRSAGSKLAPRNIRCSKCHSDAAAQYPLLPQTWRQRQPP
jgi:hypothetical protein